MFKLFEMSKDFVLTVFTGVVDVLGSLKSLDLFWMPPVLSLT